MQSGGHLPPRLLRLALTVAQAQVQAQAKGAIYVGEFTGRLICEALHCTPADVSALNPPETRDEQRDRLVALIRMHNAKRLRRRAFKDRRDRREAQERRDKRAKRRRAEDTPRYTG